MLKKILLNSFVVLLLSAFVLANANAEDRKMIGGAAPLSSGQGAFTLDLGFDLPEPMLYGVKFNGGITDRIQLGLSASFWVAINTVGIDSLFNILKSDDESHFLSLYVNPWALNIIDVFVDDDSTEDDWDFGNAWIFVVDTGLGYEYRFGDEKRGGIYFKTGPEFFIGGNVDGNFFGAFGTDVILLAIRPGFHHMLGENFSMGFEPTIYLGFVRGERNNDETSLVGCGAKANLTWAF